MPIAPWIPIAIDAAKTVGENILSGINNRKARLYNSPAEQVKRLAEAGLPQSAGSQISGGVQTPTNVTPSKSVNEQINQSVSTSVQRKQRELLEAQLKEQDLKNKALEDEIRNKLNPTGTYTGTNQGTNIMQEQQAQALANDVARITKNFMPNEKALGIAAMSQGINKTISEIQNNLQTNKNLITQGKIMLKDYQIKNILAGWQDDMSRAEYINLIHRNTGLKYENDIKEIAAFVEMQTQFDKITIVRNAALTSGESLKAAQLSNILTNLSMPSTNAYYTIRKGFDDATLAKPNMMNTLLYLGMFQPTQSNYSFGQLLGSLPNVNFNSSKEIYLPNK